MCWGLTIQTRSENRNRLDRVSLQHRPWRECAIGDGIFDKGPTMKRFLHHALAASLAAAPASLAALAAAIVLAPAPAHAGCTDYPGPGVNWSNCRKRNVVLSGSDFTGANFKDIDILGSDLRNGKFDKVNFSRALMNRVNMSGSSAQGADFRKVESARTVFRKTGLQNANFEKSVMFRTDMTGADLSGANINKAEFSRAVLADANLENAMLSFANLARADFRGANMDGVDLNSSWTYLSRFDGVDLSGVKNLSQAQIDIACGNADTKLPDGLESPNPWPCDFD